MNFVDARDKVFCSTYPADPRTSLLKTPSARGALTVVSKQVKALTLLHQISALNTAVALVYPCCGRDFSI